MIDPALFGKEMGGLIREAQAPVLKRLEALESRQLERGEKGDPGAAGADGRSGIDGKDGRDGIDGAPGEKGADGHDGRDGKDADPILLPDVAKELLGMPELKALVSLLVAEGIVEYVKANPPRDGVDGKDGRDGIDGKDGNAGADGVKGLDGANGIDGKDGAPGKDGERGEKGMEGAGVADLLIDRDGVLVATMTDGRMKLLGPVVGKDGQNGRDGLSVESLDRVYDKEAHEIVERWVAAGQAKELRYAAGGIKHGGYWRENTKAQAGETWTHNGVCWIAKCATTAKPDRDSADWLIFANKGRDGDNGKNGRDLAPAPPVKLGG